MDRRDFIRLFSVGTVAAMGGELALRRLPASLPGPVIPEAVYEDIDASALELAESIQYMTTTPPDSSAYLKAFAAEEEPVTAQAPTLSTYLEKMENYESSHATDVYLKQTDYPTLVSTFKRLDRVQNLVGHGNFNVISFDEMLNFADRYESIGQFDKTEIDFLEQLFTGNASEYGFFGDKVIDNLTATIPERDRIKVPRTGHFLYRGDSLASYQKVVSDVGPSVILTSGIRSIVKQAHLFLAKTIQAKGNLSRASRSLAPPGHSYHGIGDFDVGKRGLGRKNFTSAFATTDEFKRLVDLGYVDMRYPMNNLLGVRYEPWHIKVV